MALLINIVNASNHTNSVLVSNHKYEIQPTFIKLHPNKNSQELANVNANVNQDLMEEILIQINGRIMINVNVSVKNFMYVKKIMFGILHVTVKM